MAWSHFFLTCGARKSLETVSPGETGLCSSSSSQASGWSDFSPAPAHLLVLQSVCLPRSRPARPPPRKPGASRVSAKRPGHLSWQLHGKAGASAVCAVSSGKSWGFRSEYQPFLFSLRFKTKCMMPSLKFDLLRQLARERCPLFPVTSFQGWKGEGRLALWKEVRVTQSYCG